MKNIQTHIRFIRISTYRSGSATLFSLALGMNYQNYKDIYVPVWLCNPFFPGVRDELPNIISFMHAWNIEIKAKVINNRLIIISVHRLELWEDISFILQT